MFASGVARAAPVDSAFTYQGRLTERGSPANGTYDLQLSLFDAPSGGSSWHLVLTNADVTVSNGLFTTAVDFGPDPFDGTARWLEIGVRTNRGGAFVALSPRQSLAPAPYALYAPSAGTATVSSSLLGNLPGGQLAGTYPGALTLNNPANVLAGNGAALTSLNANSLASGIVPDARLGANVARLDANQTFTGSNLFRTLTTFDGSGLLGAGGSLQVGANVAGGDAKLIYFGDRPFVYIGENGLDDRLDFMAGLYAFQGGWVGIGLTNPQAPLHVAGVVMADDYLAAPRVIIGANHTDLGFLSSIGGGEHNLILDDVNWSTIGGGADNYIGTNAWWATIGGGEENTNRSGGATVAGGWRNTIHADSGQAFIGGGEDNGVYAPGGAIVGGWHNDILSGSDDSAVGGGSHNIVWSNAPLSTIAGGADNRVYGTYGTVGGGQANESRAAHATVAGGQGNLATGIFATIGGGFGNVATNRGAIVAGGEENMADGERAVIGGGFINEASGLEATVAGGRDNRASGERSTVGGGVGNIATKAAATASGGANNTATGAYATIGGGYLNTASSYTATISGGDSNTIQDNSASATVGGGYHNTIDSNAFSATIGGGGWNTVGTGAIYATVPGGLQNTAGGNFSFAAGYRAKTTSTGAFVWGDSTDHDIWAASANEFVVRATGGVYFFTAVNPADGFPTAGVQLHAGDPGWQNWSDREAKENFQAVDTREVLDKLCALPLTEWNMKAQAPSVRHLGPMAQDFHAAFGLGGGDDKRICSVDVDGVALAAIQGLNQKVEQQRDENAALKRELESLKQLVGQLTRERNGGAQ